MCRADCKCVFNLQNHQDTAAAHQDTATAHQDTATAHQDTAAAHQDHKTMSSSDSPPPQQQRVSEAESDEELSEGGETGGEMQVEEEPSAAAAAPAAAAEGSPRQSQSRRTRRHGRPSASQRAPAEEEDDDDDDIDVDCLIEEVREREPLWNMADRRHADTGVTRRLWDEVCRTLFPRRESLHPQQQSKLVGKVRKRWRSLRDRFKREFNDEMKAPSGSAGRKRSRYKYGQALSFLRRTMLSRVTFSSHRAPASSSAPSEAIPPESATEGHVGRPHTSVPSSDPSVLSSDPSVPSTSSAPSSGALLQASLLASDAEQLAFPLPHPSDPATSTPPLGSWRQRQRGQERSYAPEFLHLNASFQGSFKILGEQVTAGFNMVQSRISETSQETSSRLDRLHSAVSPDPANLFFQSMLMSMEKLSFEQQMRVMNTCHNAALQAINESTHTPHHTSTPIPHHTPHYQTQPQYPHQQHYQTQLQSPHQHHYQTPRHSHYPTQSQYPTQSPQQSRPLDQITSPMFSLLNFSLPPTPTPPPSGQPLGLTPTSTAPQTSRVSPPIDVVQPSGTSSSHISTQHFENL
ncbi:uncharacterized protein LOC143766363 isoform X1 [Ranitomeya variabilis]|uniref:uncharacterized protein LOC143766363 isoform X1 n=1 Tax=Ranitomeya variabilis TaxID=490064 RepID=UPI0040575D17